MLVYDYILESRKQNQKLLAVLIDPDQCKGSLLAATIAALKTEAPDLIFVGGSHHTGSSIDSLVELLQEEVKVPVVLFPGNSAQFSAHANAILYLSLLSGRNADFLIGQHVSSALAVKMSGVEVIPTGYLLIDGGKMTSVEYITNTKPIPRDKSGITLSTAVAGELLGMKLIYLEAGSGAAIPVASETIELVRTALSIPLIVGGGIRQPEQMVAAFDAGADLVVVGNVFEGSPSLISAFVSARRTYNSDEEASN